MVRSKVTKKRYYESDGSDAESEPEVVSRPPAKKKGRGSMTKLSQPQKIIYKDDISDLSESEPEEVDDDSDFGAKPKKSPKKKKQVSPKKSKKVVAKKSPAKAKKANTKMTPKKAAKKPAKPAKKGKATNGFAGRSSGRQTIRKSYADDSDSEDEDEDESESEQESEESESEVEVIPIRKKGKGGKVPPKKLPKKNVAHAKKKVVKPQHPPVGEMFTTAIKRLRENPRKGSSLAAIKGFMAEEWGLVIPKYAEQIKKYIKKAVESGEVKQTKGKGASGRFTVPGLKGKKKKRKNALTKKWDEDEEEYVVKKTARDEDREKTEAELEQLRQQRMEEAVRKELEKANRPQKPRAPKKTEWEVEMIKGMKVTEEETYYKVKWLGSSKMTWEPEEHLRGCQDAIDNFLIEEKTRIREEEMKKKKLEEMREEGTFEVSKILSVEIDAKGKREFLVRWKGCKPSEDTWEPEENLDGSEELIESFMEKHEKMQDLSNKELRAAPKKVMKFQSAKNEVRGRKAGWNGTRMTYFGMDDSGDEY